LHPEGTNGSATGKQQGQDRCQFLHFLRLGNSRLEINRGRTEWRKLAR
jgi:fatty acyl-ACP thioesterase A